MDNTRRFSNRVDNYVKYRPGYPAVVLDFLSEASGFTSSWKVADIGSGTDISTSLFLDNVNTVYAVEPNDAMREKAEELPGRDFEKAKGRQLSSSYIPVEENDIYEKMMEQPRLIFVTCKRTASFTLTIKRRYILRAVVRIT
jgi:tRNA1(Val) A37 N6-methylase TrmN6